MALLYHLFFGTHYTFRGGASHIGERSGIFFVFIINPYDYKHWSVGAAL